MNKKIIQTELFIHPEAFHSDKFYDHVLEQVKLKETTCDCEVGYIDQIYQIIDIKNPHLLDDGYCKVRVDVECNIFKPEIGKKVEVIVKTISEHGIFAELGRNRFLIPIATLESRFEYRNNKYYEKGKSTQIDVSDVIQVNVTNFRYDNKCFCCIGELC